MQAQTPIIIMAFNRPDYLRRVLVSIRDQKDVDLAQYRIVMFQDGAVDLHTGIRHAEDAVIEENQRLFREIFPQGEVRACEHNVGVAFNFDRAERWVFEELGHEIAYFFEDDLELSPYYLSALGQLAQLALNDERIAYVSAYGNHKATLSQQKARSSEVIPLDHKWGFALTRRQWFRQKAIVDGYLDIVKLKPYRQRDNNAIREYFAKLGYGSSGTSQDAAKDVASCVLGTVKLNTFACFAKYIGEIGLHSNRLHFEKEGYSQTELYDAKPNLKAPLSSYIDDLVLSTKAGGKNSVENRSYPHVAPPKAGRLEMKARMSERELALFTAFVSNSKRYFEFGSGGSTVIASDLVKDWVISVDSSREWLDNVRKVCVGRHLQPELKFIDIGKTGPWGVPIEPEKIVMWPKYHSSVWSPKACDADLFMVDGRFRVACFAQIVLHCKPDAIIGIHDFASRPHFHCVKEIAREIATAEDMSFFQPLPNVSAHAYRILAEFMTVFD